MDQAEQLRKMVKNTTQKPTARVITVTSGKGGVGKTSISLNLAIWLSRMGKHVVVLDTDFGLANIEVMLGVRPEYNLADMMFRGKELKDIITQGPENIGFISGGSGIHELSRLSRDQVVQLARKLGKLDLLADMIIVDIGAGIADSVMEFVVASSEVLLVVTPEPTSITDAYALLKSLNKMSEFSREHTTVKMIANRVQNEEEGKGLYEKMRVVADKFLNISLRYCGAIPQDEQVSRAIIRQKPIAVTHPGSAPAKAVKKIAQELMESEEPKEKREREGISALFYSLIHSRRKKEEESGK